MTDDFAVPDLKRHSTHSLVTSALFAVAIFTSASLVFVVQPMVTKLILPLLGGSPAVWNTAMVFFQTALLAGYLYAHLLQRISSLRLQAGIHIALLLLSALWLPLQIRGLLGDPDTSAPIVWLLGTLAVSIGAPFAILSATAPLLQAWFARVQAGNKAGQNPYILYAASNLGSFLALLSYPVLIEPLATLTLQRISWGIGYGLFVTMVLVLLAWMWNHRDTATQNVATAPRSPSIPWPRKLVLITLAAAPSSLMLGVTAHISTDVASAPFLWVMPLALYLLTFVIAFQTKPWIPLWLTHIMHAATLIALVIFIRISSTDWLLQLPLHLLVFFLTTLLCHQQMAARRPAPDRLTEFYLLMSLGGVIGGAFTALLAPVIFKTVIEYPIVLILACLARSPTQKPWDRRDILLTMTSLAIALSLPILFEVLRYHPSWLQRFTEFGIGTTAQLFLLAAGFIAILVRDRLWAFMGLATVILCIGIYVSRNYDWMHTERSFFGVMRIANVPDPDMGGDVYVMMHGTTLHGAQGRHPEMACTPTMYYHQTTPIGQAAEILQARRPAISMGIVGQGSGAMAAYKRAADSVTFFEIDPMVDRLSRDPKWFTYINGCAKGEVKTVIGDARLTLEKQPKGSFDYLLIDAFSSDAIPSHLLTREAIKSYVEHLTDDGVVVLHLSNRHMDLARPAMASADELGLPYLHQLYRERTDVPDMLEASTEALVIARTPEALADFKADGRWSQWEPGGVKPWTDDYIDLFGAIMRDLRR